MNSRLGKSVLDLCRAKIRLGEFKAVYRIASVMDDQNTILVNLSDQTSFEIYIIYQPGCRYILSGILSSVHVKGPPAM